ncbi:OmpH family outer membrane protein [Fulvivirga ulvae]|uniref:OmpH family outer membrane protein n=1 Tax=Fulvivirga ulvae TaxID=2904245 RepID=UPI001F267775|nr:OmpH family outer membrane protein [Fulvivirga ulvae]UII30384.1 OmpH family outer membrane protein [Fulvivirga ulvae]
MKSIYWLLILILAALSAWSLFLSYQSPKIAYVRSQELIFNYSGTKEARVDYENKKAVWMANVDTLRMDFQRAVNSYNNDYKILTPSERQEKEAYLDRQKSQLDQYTLTIEEKSREEDQKMMQAVLNQVNSFVEEYAKTNNYDVILGTTASGSVLYGDESLDITEDLLKALNENYEGK